MNRALLVIDVQNEYFTGALPITHPKDHFPQLLQVVDHARTSKLPTIFVQHHETSLPIFQRGTDGWKLHREVEERPCDLVLEKSLPGCFTNTPLQEWLDARKIEIVTIVGYMTHICCDTTSRQAMHLGYKVEFLSDATGTLALDNQAGKVSAEELHRSILCAQQHFISEVIDRAAWKERVG